MRMPQKGATAPIIILLKYYTTKLCKMQAKQDKNTIFVNYDNIYVNIIM